MSPFPKESNERAFKEMSHFCKRRRHRLETQLAPYPIISVKQINIHYNSPSLHHYLVEVSFAVTPCCTVLLFKDSAGEQLGDFMGNKVVW